MKITKKTRLICCAVYLAAQFAVEAQTHFTDEADITRFLHDHFDGTNAGMVIGLLDARGGRILSAGKLDNHTSQEVDGDTLFEIGSVTKTFTALLLLDMVKRGEMKLDDAVAKYLPKNVKTPARQNKEITLLNLAAQDSGLPFNADNLAAGDWVEAYNAYNAADLYAFLSRYTLTNDPGRDFQYSNVGMSLLGHVMELRAGTNFESLIVNRICRPLGMSSTFITVGAESKVRLAMGHDEEGRSAKYYRLQVMAGAGALLSTANDLLRYLGANLGLTPSSLHPLMAEMQVVRHHSPVEGRTAMPWFDQGVYNPPGTDLLGHAGGTGGCSTFIAFDRLQRHGVVVLSNQRTIHSSSVGWRILQGAPLSGLDAATLQPLREYVAAGFSFDLDKQSGLLRITKVYPNSPAAAAGLTPGLIVARINGVHVAGMSTADSMELMRGPVGTKVELVLLTPDGSRTNMVELIKSRIQL
jgi:CubicO group peptidase (beta-lactamase class C family)